MQIVLGYRSSTNVFYYTLPGKNLSGKALFKIGAGRSNSVRHLKIKIHVQSSKFLSVLMFSFSSCNRMIAHDKWKLGKKLSDPKHLWTHRALAGILGILGRFMKMFWIPGGASESVWMMHCLEQCQPCLRSANERGSQICD
jgi:hypothetical protein